MIEKKPRISQVEIMPILGVEQWNNEKKWFGIMEQNIVFQGGGNF